MRRSRCATTPGHCTVKAKLIGIKVQSNCNNVAANWLGVVEDTTDEAGCKDPTPVTVREVADADRTVLRRRHSCTNEVADVSVIEARLARFGPAPAPTAVFSLPVTLLNIAEAPTAS